MRPVAKPEQSLSKQIKSATGNLLRSLPLYIQPGRVRLATLPTREFSVAEGSALLMAAFLVSAVLGIVRQILFNARFGAGMEASAYYAAFRLPDTISTLLAGGTLANALIPVLFSVLRNENKAAARRLISLVITALTAFIVPTVLLSILFAPQFVSYLLAPGFDAETSQLTVILTRLMLLELLLVAINGVAGALLYSRNQFLLPALAIATRNVALITGIIAAMIYPPIGIYGPTCGAIADALIQFGILLPGLRQDVYRYRPVWAFRDRRLGEVIRLLIPNGLSGAVNYAGGIVDTAFASLARQTAGIAALFNAFILIGLPIRLLGVAIGQAAFSRLAAHAAANDGARLRQTLRWALGMATALAALAAAAMALLGRPMIAILFERGQFDAAAGDLTYTLLVAYVVALPAYIATEVITRALIALHDTRTPLVTNCIQLAGRAIITPLLLGPLDVLAIPIAFAVTSTLETIVLGAVLLLKIHRRYGRQVAR